MINKIIEADMTHDEVVERYWGESFIMELNIKKECFNTINYFPYKFDYW